MKEKSSPVVESAVCGVLTELAAVSVRLHKQPGGGGDRSDETISGGQSFGGDRSGETISLGQSFGGDTGCFCYCSSQFSELVVRVLVEIDLVKLFLGVRVLVETQGVFVTVPPNFQHQEKNDG